MKIFTFVSLLGLACGAAAHAQERISHGRFEDVALYMPNGEVQQVVLFLSGDGGWDEGTAEMARVLVDQGAMVAGISAPQFFAALEADGGDCVYPDGDLENLSHYLQGYAKLPTYFTPLLAGYSAGASLAYAMLAQAPSGIFAGALSVGFCPELDLQKPLCAGENLRFAASRNGTSVELMPAATLGVPWAALHGEQDQVCDVQSTRAFVTQVSDASLTLLPDVSHDYSVPSDWVPQYLAAYRRLTAAHRATRTAMAPPASLAGLPLVDVPADGAGDTFAVLLSGDGGWAGLDKNVAAALAAQGVPVAGLDSLRYFWTARTPQGIAQDLDRILSYYSAHWHKSRALLIGYSQGADVLPFAVNRLSAASSELVVQTVLIGLSETASFEFHLSNWLGGAGDGVPILPEVEQLTAATTLCLYGEDEEESLCPKIAAGHVESQSFPGGHHFDGDYDKLAQVILERVQTP